MMKNKISEQNIIKWLRHLHMNPKLSFEEYETSQYVYDVLENFNAYTLERFTETSVVATLKGKKGGKTIAIRADIDALPIHEEEQLNLSH